MAKGDDKEVVLSDFSFYNFSVWWLNAHVYDLFTKCDFNVNYWKLEYRYDVVEEETMSIMPSKNSPATIVKGQMNLKAFFLAPPMNHKYQHYLLKITKVSFF